MIYGAILAGGSGTRMHVSSMPKQFLPLRGKPIIIHTLEKMIACSKFDAVYLGVHPSWMSYMYDLLDKYDVGAVYYDWDKTAVSNLHKLLSWCDAEIVLSSDWRQTKTLEDMKCLMKILKLI